MKTEIVHDLLPSIPGSHWWDARGVWEDGSSEPGFIVAVERGDQENQNKLLEAEGKIVKLAEHYEQAAIYKFVYEHNVLLRSTVPVLDPTTEADVPIELDEITPESIS